MDVREEFTTFDTIGIRAAIVRLSATRYVTCLPSTFGSST